MEERRYREFINRRSSNRDSLNGFGIFGIGAGLLVAAATSCNIF